MTSNPLLKDAQWPPFDAIRPSHVAEAIDHCLARGRQEIQRLMAQAPEKIQWLDLEGFKREDERLHNAWSPVSHLHSVADSEAWRGAYNAALPKLSDYATEIGQNKHLYAIYQALHQQPLDQIQRKIVEDALRDFRLAGVSLPEAQKNRFKTLARELSELGSKFGQNVLDATMAWHHHITDKRLLAGLPENTLAQLAQQAKSRGLDGYVVTLDQPIYVSVMTYADNRDLRQTLYHAYTTRASDQGPNAGQFDNTPLLMQILKLRHEKANLLGFPNYAELSLASKMAESTQQVFDFLYELVAKVRPKAQSELEELKAFAAEHGVTDLQAWDVSYFSNKLKQLRYDIDQEALRPWFPLPAVLDGLFEICHRLYGINFRRKNNVAVWHPDVEVYEILDDGEVIAGFYLDLYARPHKRDGAWMDECRNRVRWSDGTTQIPVAYLTCNFNPPINGQPALLTHDDVVCLFHEFGHGLHHMLTEMDMPEVSGIRGVPWDAVELPSQFHENFCYQAEGLRLVSRHIESGQPLPDTIIEKIIAAKNFHAALAMIRQLEFGLFDFHLHADYNPSRPKDPQAVLDEVRDKVAVIKPPKYNRFQNSFSHIFAGGYAAGYYSYLWAEVLSADAFSKFEEDGLFHPQTGRAFRKTILAKGGSEDPLSLFRQFRGRDPQIDALLRQTGIIQCNG